ncbi:hypothetical protein [Yunchengibacter salinarum]|uniref:hypothetical protein n=1 Tax=Yunchengibacter salinarum TaxID=3133399 RepID=UPI0035B5E327
MRAALLVLMVPALAACGFKPLYDGGNEAAPLQALDRIMVPPVKSRLAQQVRNRILTRVPAASNPDFRLVIALDDAVQGFGIRPDESVTQERLTLSLTARLVPLDPPGTERERAADRAVWRITLRERAIYDVVQSDFSNVMTREDTARRLGEALADRLVRRLAMALREGELAPEDKPENARGADAAEGAGP